MTAASSFIPQAVPLLAGSPNNSNPATPTKIEWQNKNGVMIARIFDWNPQTQFSQLMIGASASQRTLRLGASGTPGTGIYIGDSDDAAFQGPSFVQVGVMGQSDNLGGTGVTRNLLVSKYVPGRGLIPTSSFVQTDADREHVLSSPTRMWRNGAQALPGGGWAQVVLNAVSFDPDGHFVSPHYVCQNTGVYLVIGFVGITASAASSFIQCFITKNDVAPGGDTSIGNQIEGTASSIVAGQAGNGAVMAAGFLKCNSGETIGLWGFSAGGGLGLNASESANMLHVMQVASA